MCPLASWCGRLQQFSMFWTRWLLLCRRIPTESSSTWSRFFSLPNSFFHVAIIVDPMTIVVSLMIARRGGQKEERNSAVAHVKCLILSFPALSISPLDLVLSLNCEESLDKNYVIQCGSFRLSFVNSLADTSIMLNWSWQRERERE